MRRFTAILSRRFTAGAQCYLHTSFPDNLVGTLSRGAYKGGSWAGRRWLVVDLRRRRGEARRDGIRSVRRRVCVCVEERRVEIDVVVRDGDRER